MSGSNLSLKDELLLLSSINKHRNSRLQKRLSYLEESSSGNDNNNKPCQLQSRDDDTYFDVDDNSVVTEQVSCYRRSSRNGGRQTSTLKSIKLESTASIRKATPENHRSGKDRDSPETIRTEFVATPRHRPSSTNVSQRHVNNYSPISIQTEMVSSRVQSNKHKKSIEKQQKTSGVVVTKSSIVKSSSAIPSNKSTDSSIRHAKKTPSISSFNTKQKSKSRSFFTRRSKHTASRDRKKKKKKQTSSKGMQLELNKKSQQSSAMQRKISDRYLKSNVGRDIVSIKEEEEVVDKVLMKTPPNPVAVDTSPRETQTQEEVAIVVKQQNEARKKQPETTKVNVAEQKKQESEQQITLYQKNTVSNKNEKDTQLKADKVREQKEIEYRKCLETVLSVANMEAKRIEKQLTQQIKAKEIEIAKQQAEAEIEKQRSIADELKRKETAEQVKHRILQLESSLANQNKVLSDKVELLMKDKMNTEEKLKKYQNELEQVKASKVDLPDISTETSTTPFSANKVENDHADLKREVERIVQEEILRASAESTDLVDDDPDTSDEQPVETNLTTYTSYELESSIVHATSSDDGGGCFVWLCCSGGEEKLDKSSWYDASSISSGSMVVEHEANDGLLGIRAV